MLGLILLVLAFVLCLLQAFRGWISPPPQPWGVPHLGWLGIAVYLLSLMLTTGGIR